ncbi:putative leucine-rich repeat receptor-like protein kinase At2g19210 [Ipomoea triloba]|uniref:putative leucine-rich repeat receptor-like protein kinase At2g19210 n=1 Tax=Ipomoea triloba TaxID=35885 RepID=UPI00125D9606|nr:putative leucine-rich repeat receptor-like protein kinase At2g19210 [Ipomoea triloba]
MKASLQVLLLCCFALANANVVNGWNPDGFISIDCGLAEGASYSDYNIGGLDYWPDAGFLESDTGISSYIQKSYITDHIDKHLWTVRSFPEGDRNCYDLSGSSEQVVKGKRVLIRASFLYGNYDGKNETPSFELHLGVEMWDRVQFRGPLDVVRKEIVHVPSSNILKVCLVCTDQGTPFISALELRPLKDDAYPTNASVAMNESLVGFKRYNYGAEDKHSIIRYPDDKRDRLWFPYDDASPKFISLSPIPPNPNEEVDENSYEVPSKVMETAVSKETAEENLTISWDPKHPTMDYYVYLHFAEVTRLLANQSREFKIYTNDDKLWFDKPISPAYFSIDTIYPESATSKAQWNLTLLKTQSSNLPPLINAMEIYIVKRFLKSQTRETEVLAMANIKSNYRLKRDNWVGDPCLPEAYLWEGLRCRYNNDYDPPIITHLNLSASRLAGNISLSISDLTSLEYLDLSNNSLTGQLPSFLSELRSLKVLNLTGNQFWGPIPQELIERTKYGLKLRIEGYDDTAPHSSCQSNNCDSKKTSKKFVIPVVTSVIPTFILLTGLLLFWRRKRKTNQGRLGETFDKKDGFLKSKNRSFTYLEILKITRNFERVLGKGGFGTVYHGCLGDIQVAVKILSQSSIQGYREFQTEAELLTRVHHRYLTSLVGYCDKDEHKALVYEYMANGNLRDFLLEKSSHVLSWIERLQIAVDAAQGLDYLHNGCKPPIIHRDVKTTNILLNEKLQAKLSDFGLSRVFTIEDGSYVSTRVVGTPGYLDPEYYESHRLTEKSDVYNFGIVILELISGRPVIVVNDEKSHILQWVSLFLETGDIKKIIDPRLNEEFDVNCVWKALELAMACASPIPIGRPNMDYVVMELKECLATEKVRRERQAQTFYSEEVIEVTPIIAQENSTIGPR